MKSTIEELALKKDFLDLSSKEKQLILSQITQEEYANIRLLLVNIEASYKRDSETLKINDTIKEKLSVTFKKKYAKRKSQPVYTNFWGNYKGIAKPVLSFASVILIVLIITNSRNNASFSDVDDVSYFLNEKKELLKVNTDYSSNLIDSNKFNKDSIIEMNKHLYINTDGLYTN